MAILVLTAVLRENFISIQRGKISKLCYTETDCNGGLSTEERVAWTVAMQQRRRTLYGKKSYRRKKPFITQTFAQTTKKNLLRRLKNCRMPKSSET